MSVETATGVFIFHLFVSADLWLKINNVRGEGGGASTNANIILGLAEDCIIKEKNNSNSLNI